MKKATPWIAGIAVEACFVGMLVLGNLRQHAFLLLFGVAMTGYLFSIRYCGWIGWRGVVLFALLFRLTLSITTPTLSDDIYRYVWDARVQSSQINPYRFEPESSHLSHLRDQEIFPRVNHPEIPTIYPPFAQALFLASYKIHPSVWSIKAAMLLSEAILAWFLLGLIRLYDQHPGQLLIFLWNPLLVVEVAGSGHVDILGITFLIVALLYAQIGGYGRAFGALAISCLSKNFAICLVPIFWRWMCTRQGGDSSSSRIGLMLSPRRAWPVLVFAAIMLVGYVPFMGAGKGLFAGLLTYAEHWEFNAPFFDSARFIFGATIARGLIALAFCTAVVLITIGRMPPVQAGYYLTGLFIWLSPTLHPWYVLWILPFLVFYRSAAWLVFSGLIAISYVVPIRFAAEGVWVEEFWVKVIPFGGFGLTWLWFWWKDRTAAD